MSVKISIGPKQQPTVIRIKPFPQRLTKYRQPDSNLHTMNIYTSLSFLLLLSYSTTHTKAAYSCTKNWKIGKKCHENVAQPFSTGSDTKSACDTKCENSANSNGAQICCNYNSNNCSMDSETQMTSRGPGDYFTDATAAVGASREAAICFRCPANCAACTGTSSFT